MMSINGVILICAVRSYVDMIIYWMYNFIKKGGHENDFIIPIKRKTSDSQKEL